MKLTITDEGKFIHKQIAPIDHTRSSACSFRKMVNIGAGRRQNLPHSSPLLRSTAPKLVTVTILIPKASMPTLGAVETIIQSISPKRLQSYFRRRHPRSCQEKHAKERRRRELSPEMGKRDAANPQRVSFRLDLRSFMIFYIFVYLGICFDFSSLIFVFSTGRGVPAADDLINNHG